jgi:hypothetical protein
LHEAVTLASEVEAIEQAEDRKQTKSVYANNPAEVLAVNGGETNRILERTKPPYHRAKHGSNEGDAFCNEGQRKWHLEFEFISQTTE